MHILPPYERILVLTEGQLGVFSSKTAACLLRYRGQDVVGVIDSTAAGTDVRTAIPWAAPVPVFESIAAAAGVRPQALFIGIAPVGGALPPEMRQHVGQALRAGIDVVSGLHAHLGDDDELATAARQSGARLVDLRKPPTPGLIAGGRARGTRCRRILTVGTDGNVGKMVTTFELKHAAQQQGLDVRLAATGQTGIMIEGCGIAVDAVVADFAAGATEQLVQHIGDCELGIIEGQGSLAHPGFSGVTLALLHGACPDAMILVHHAGRTRYKAEPHGPIPPLDRLCAAYEQAASLLHPARVVAVAVNGFGVEQDVLQAEMRRIEEELQIPVADPITPDVQRLLAAAMGD
jgi:uncharacterized NAD-dependent epimerase/dehydratase family protein